MTGDKPGPEKQFVAIFQLRLDPNLVMRIERYARKTKLMVRGKPNRSEAIRRLIEIGLKAEGKN